MQPKFKFFLQSHEQAGAEESPESLPSLPVAVSGKEISFGQLLYTFGQTKHPSADIPP